MRAFLTVFLGCVLAINGLPSFEWDMERHSSSGVPLLTIQFPSGEVDHAVLEAFNPIPQQETERSEDIDNCIFTGHLQNEPDVTVTLAGGCPNEKSFEIMLNSQKLSGFMYKVTDGKVTELESPYKHMSKGDFMNSDMVAPASKSNRKLNPTSRATTLPAAGFVANVRLVYDQLFKGKWGTDSVNAIRRVMAFTQDMYRWNTLTTTLRFNIVSVEESSLTITGGASDANLDTVGQLSTDASINGNIYFTFENNQYGTIGIAWIGAVCDVPTYRSALVEYFFTDAQSAQVVAHEFGHNLGMDHDFDSTGAGRTSSTGKTCKNIGGIMDYNQASYTQWSQCSVEDFLAYYNSVSTFCLALDNGSLPTIATTTAAPTTAAPTTSSNVCMTVFYSGCGSACKYYSYNYNVICQGTYNGVTYQCRCSLYNTAG